MDQPTQPQAPAPAVPAVPPPPPPKGSSRRLVVVAIAVVVVLALIAIGVAVAGGGGDTNVATSSPATVPPQPPAAPEGLQAIPGTFRVKLTWDRGVQGIAPAPVKYDIQRGTRTVGHTEQTSWIDDDVIPGEDYTYQVIAISQEGLRAASTVHTSTKTAPPGTAALDGVFNVKLHPTSHSGLSSFHDKDRTAGWQFTPGCTDPPCDTTVKDLHWKAFVIDLQQNGGAYQGSKSITGVVSCGGQDVSATFTVSIKATKADAVKDGWRVTAFTGTLSQYSPAQLGCVSSNVHYDVSGTFVQGAGR